MEYLLFPKFKSTQVNLFLDSVKRTCNQHGISLYLGKGKYVRISGKGKVGGYFDDENRILAVATNIPKNHFLELLIHEVCHLDQWTEKSVFWTDHLTDSIVMIDDFFNGTECDHGIISNAFDTVVKMEADCELRAIEKIKEYDLPICTKRYARKANAYLLSHKAMLYYCSWYRKSPYSSKICKKMDDFLHDPEYYTMGNTVVDPKLFKSCF